MQLQLHSVVARQTALEQPAAAAIGGRIKRVPKVHEGRRQH